VPSHAALGDHPDRGESSDQDPDVRDARRPVVGVRQPLEPCGGAPEQCDGVSATRVGKQQVRQIPRCDSDGAAAAHRYEQSGHKHFGRVSRGDVLDPMRFGPAPRPRRVVDLLNPAAALLPAANVIMQLSSPGVGHGVLESPVDSGNVYEHPFKRARTTGTYLAAATLGTDADRALIRAGVDKVHAQVRSNPSSPVSYNAFDPKLQLWVAACLYRYYVDMHEFLYGPLDDQSADAIYQHAARLGTTLQVRSSMWPTDRAAFDEFWKRSLDAIQIDPPVREHLHGVAALAFLPAPLRQLAGPFNLFATTGFLSTEFREQMQLPWTPGQQRRFGWLLSGLRIADRVIPRDAWILGYRLYLWDMRTRARRGRPVV
jgi:uncharacterized protein (DUF2236 family)